jgi:poly-gamma-glutamate capsule biosynthesis protein CapA/YwtB (metallophosphatase superfamily)
MKYPAWNLLSHSFHLTGLLALQLSLSGCRQAAKPGAPALPPGPPEKTPAAKPATIGPLPADSTSLTLFLCGDVMTGRGIDQILPKAGDPVLYESFVRDAREYVRLAEQVNGKVERPVGYDYIWGDALAEWEQRSPAVKIVNLETSVTASDDYWPDKAVLYRMHPGNVPCLTAAGIDACVLGNNHVLDWGYGGLRETLKTLADAHIRTAGAGQMAEEAAQPVVWSLGAGRRLLLFSYGSSSSGSPAAWAATADRAGINYLPDFSAARAQTVLRQIRSIRRPGDVIIFSVHWGGNWGFDIPASQRGFAHRLIDSGAVDLIHGHSSHHAKGIEVYRGKLILYGCGDFITDYEGIGGQEEYHGDLSLMYFPTIDLTSGQLLRLEMAPMQVRRLRLNRAGQDDQRWLLEMLNREGKTLGTRVEAEKDGVLELKWNGN